MRRKPGTLLPIELAILEVCASRSLSGSPECHGFLIASLIKGMQDAKRLTAYGTLYRALSRLEKAGFLSSRWEDMSFTNETRPRRRLYRITDAGSEALNNYRSTHSEQAITFQAFPLPNRELTSTQIVQETGRE